ncbi:MAG TPA: hypothetical protein VKT51_07785 [Candidatus Eremiobacteraceae bacterium]|nr:hypothetical protein [Candidatus Eremiobacteraceae bacterium]
MAAVLIAAAALRIYEAVARPLHVDEGLSLQLAGEKASDALAYLYHADVHPPGFTFFLKPFVALHAPDVVVRIAMALLGTLSVWLLMRLLLVWNMEPGAAVAAGGAAALMPSLIYYDGMIRMYAPFDAAIVASFVLLSIAVSGGAVSPTARRCAWIGWTACSAISIWLLYLGFFFLAAQLAFLLVARRGALVRGLIGAMVAICSWLPQLPVFLHQSPRGGLAFAQELNDVPGSIAALAAQATIAPFAQGPVLMALSALVWLAAIWAFVATLRRAGSTMLPYLALPAALTVAAAIATHKALYMDRYYLVAAYALCAWLGVAVAEALHSRRFAARIALAAAGAALAAQAIAYAAIPSNYTADWPAVERVLRSSAAPQDVFVFVRGTPIRVIDRTDLLAGRTYGGLLSPDDVQSTIEALRGHARIWYIEYQPYQVDPRLRIAHFLAATYQLGGQWYFPRDVPGESVRIAFFHT